MKIDKNGKTTRTLSELQGSEKQIAWADKIRTSYVKMMSREIMEYNENIPAKEKADMPNAARFSAKQRDKRVVEFNTKINESDSSYWINNHSIYN